MRILKSARLAGALLIVAALGAAAVWPERIEVDTARVVRGPLEVTIDEEGETRVRERFIVSAPVAGRLQRVELEPGDPVVCARTIVARLVPAAPPLLDTRTRGELNAAVEAARAAGGEARARRDRAVATLERTQSAARRQATLSESGAISRDELEMAQTAMRTAESELRAAEFAVSRTDQEVRLARARLVAPAAGGSVVEVRAPVDGVVLRRLRESESVVPAGEPLIEIGDPQQLDVVVDLLSTDATRVSTDDIVWIEDWGGDRPLAARVRRVEPSGFMKVSALGVEERRVNAIIDFTEPFGAQLLGDGYRVEVRIVVWRQADVLKVPVGALFRHGDGWAVFEVDHGRARSRTVSIGERNDKEAQILRGLHAEQSVVLHPPDTLADGARIAERRE